MSNIILGKNTEILIDAVPMTNHTSYNLDKPTATIEASHLPDSHEKYLPGMKAFKFNIAFDFDPTNQTHRDLAAGEKIFDIKIYPNGVAAGFGYQLPSIVSNFSFGAQKGEKVTGSVDFEPAGELVILGA